MHPMDVSASLKADREILVDKLESIATPVKDGQLEQVSTVSSGDPLIGKLIAEAIEYVGDDGGIIAEKAPVDNVEREYVDGYYLQSGFLALQSGKKELDTPHVVVCVKPLRSRSDAVEVVNNVVKAVQHTPNTPLKIVFIGHVEGEAHAIIVDNINRGILDAVVITPPPSFGSMAKELLEDIALYAHCQAIVDTTKMNYSDQDIPLFQAYVGKLERVVASKFESTLFGLGTTEDIEARIANIKDQIKVEVSDQANERLRDRVAKLEGKIALFRIGAPTDSAKEELEYRVEDAINATRAASRHGVVPGGGTTLLALSKEKSLSDITVRSLRDTFRQLLINANLPSEIKLAEALEAPQGKGFNLRKDDTLVDMVKEGILDPKLAVEQTIINATDVVANAITVAVTVIFEDDIKE